MTDNVEISFQQILDALLDFNTPFPARFLYNFSDIDESDLNQFKSVWLYLPAWRRRGLVEDLAELSESDTLLSFRDVCLHAVEDEDPQVRLSAVQALSVYEESSFAILFLNLLKNDKDIDIQAAAASALARYVYLGEIESIEKEVLFDIEEGLLESQKEKYPEKIRKCALEALGYSSRPEVTHLITDAYHSGKQDWIASALVAMGRSADKKWKADILAMLDHRIPSIRYEAARAAGELEISDAVIHLLELVDDPDEDTRLASIWSLTQIGGEGVGDLLEDLLDEAEYEQDIEFLETAIENLAFNESVQLYPLIDFPDEPHDSILENRHGDFDEFEDSNF